MCEFIDAHRERFGVVPICRALSEHGIKIAPRTYWARRSRPPSRRALRDAAVTEILAGIYETDERGRRKPESLYGSLKMWEYLRRQGISVARCTVERLMRASGWRGVTPGPPDPHHRAGSGSQPSPGPGEPEVHRGCSRAAARRGLHLRAAGWRRVRLYRVRH